MKLKKASFIDNKPALKWSFANFINKKLKKKYFIAASDYSISNSWPGFHHFCNSSCKCRYSGPIENDQTIS
jgi:hypothetical protein